MLQDGEITIVDSNAILVYLVRRYAPDSQWLPEEALAAARVQRWLSIAAGELTYGPAVGRRIAQWGGPGDRPRALEVGRQLLEFMDAHLADTPYLAAAHPTLADLACYSYTAHAPEGGLSLQPYPAVREWLSRVEALPHFEPMPASPLPPRVSDDGFQGGALARLEANLKAHMADGQPPGLVALLSRGGETHVLAAGAMTMGGPPIARDAIFRIASMTKPITRSRGNDAGRGGQAPAG